MNLILRTIGVKVLTKYFTTKEYKKYLKILEDNRIITDIVYKDENGEPTYKYKVGEASKRYTSYLTNIIIQIYV